MPKKKRISDEYESPQSYLNAIVEAKLNDESWAENITLDQGQLTEDQMARLVDHWKKKRLASEDHRYEKDDQKELF
jgi:hypothetical protein